MSLLHQFLLHYTLSHYLYLIFIALFLSHYILSHYFYCIIFISFLLHYFSMALFLPHSILSHYSYRMIFVHIYLIKQVHVQFMHTRAEVSVLPSGSAGAAPGQRSALFPLPHELTTYFGLI
uniref:Uncharacterized protein n=1 Tax=Amazona collaria TaxID=241587 RepID=A0A8B9GBR2_9PSIT